MTDRNRNPHDPEPISWEMVPWALAFLAGFALGVLAMSGKVH